MTKYGSKDLKIEVDNASDALVDLSNYIDEIDGANIEAMLADTHAFGDDWFEHIVTGLKRMEPVTIGGFYDDTAASGPDVILNALGDTRTLKLTYGASKITTVEVILSGYDRSAVRGELTRFEATLTPTGEAVDA